MVLALRLAFLLVFDNHRFALRVCSHLIQVQHKARGKCNIDFRWKGLRGGKWCSLLEF